MFDFTYSKNLRWNEWELYLAQNVQTSDMLPFSWHPYNFDSPIRRCIQERVHPYAYIDLSPDNQKIAKEEIDKVNHAIRNSLMGSISIPKIPVKKIEFYEYAESYGYTIIKCEPYTKTGKIAKYPFALFFTSDTKNTPNTAHGRLYYEKDGEIGKADVCLWDKKHGDLMELKRVDGVLKITKRKIERL